MDVPFYSKKSFLAGRLFKVSSDFRNPPADKEKKSTELGLWCPQRPDKKPSCLKLRTGSTLLKNTRSTNRETVAETSQ